MVRGIAAALTLPGECGFIAIGRQPLGLRHAILILLFALGIELIGARRWHGGSQRGDGEAEETVEADGSGHGHGLASGGR